MESNPSDQFSLINRIWEFSQKFFNIRIIRDTIKERLIKLEDLYEEGLITQEEYKTKRLEILDDL